MRVEHERKFLIKKLPEDFEYTDKIEMEQCYLNKKSDSIEIRIRKYVDNRCYFDLKQDGDIDRCEIFSRKITTNEYDELKKSAKSILSKTRYKKYSYLLSIFFDVFHESDLILCEVESTNPENNWIVDEYIPENWFEREVTGENEYKNRNIAKDEKR